MRFSWAGVAAYLAIGPGLARADASNPVPLLPHRIGGALSAGIAYGSIDRINSEGNRFKGEGLYGIHATYGYQVLEGFELGAGLSYLNGYDMNALATTLRLRPYVPIGERVELGLTLSGGLLVWPHLEYVNIDRRETDEFWTGTLFSLGIDCTVWFSREFAFQPFVTGAGGSVNGYSIHGAGFYGANVGIGFLGRL
jgi:hypothetical protein